MEVLADNLGLVDYEIGVGICHQEVVGRDAGLGDRQSQLAELLVVEYEGDCLEVTAGDTCPVDVEVLVALAFGHVAESSQEEVVEIPGAVMAVLDLANELKAAEELEVLDLAVEAVGLDLQRDKTDDKTTTSVIHNKCRETFKMKTSTNRIVDCDVVHGMEGTVLGETCALDGVEGNPMVSKYRFHIQS